MFVRSIRLDLEHVTRPDIEGIAAINLQPNTPTLDARPLVEQAVAYAVKNAIATVTADTGSYYFLTLHNATTAHAYLNAAANLTIDWQHSDLFSPRATTPPLPARTAPR